MAEGNGAGSANDAAATSSALAGKVQAEKSGYASELVAYRVVGNLANEIAGTVSAAIGRHPGEVPDQGAEGGAGDEDRPAEVRVLLVDSLDYAAGGSALAEVEAQTSLIETVFEERRREHDELLGRAGQAPTEEGGAGLAALGFLPALAPLAPLLAGAGKAVLEMPQYAEAIAKTLAYFRTDHQIVGREMKVGQQALLFSTAGALSAAGVKAFVPGFYSVEGSELLGRLATLAGEAARLKTERDALAKLLPKPPTPGPGGATSGTPAGGAPGTSPGTAPGEEAAGDAENPGGGSIDEGLVARIARAIVETDAALLLHDGLRAAWTAPPKAATPAAPAASPASAVQASPTATASAAPASATSPTTVTAATTPAAPQAPDQQRSVLDKALAQEKLDALEISHLLVLSAFSSGGDSTARDRLWREDRLGFMGGAAVGYMLAGTDGAILEADTLSQFGVTGGTLRSYTAGEGFEDIDFKPDKPGRERESA